ncbi:TPA: hypothetical protein ACXFAB_005117, partial [Klebsiella quasipneumoniae]
FGFRHQISPRFLTSPDRIEADEFLVVILFSAGLGIFSAELRMTFDTSGVDILGMLFSLKALRYVEPRIIGIFRKDCQ